MSGWFGFTAGVNTGCLFRAFNKVSWLCGIDCNWLVASITHKGRRFAEVLPTLCDSCGKFRFSPLQQAVLHGKHCCCISLLQVWLSLVTTSVLFLCLHLVQPPPRYPDIFPVLISDVSCALFLWFSCIFHYAQFVLTADNAKKIK